MKYLKFNKLYFLKFLFNILFKYGSVMLGLKMCIVQYCQWLGIMITDKLQWLCRILNSGYKN